METSNGADRVYSFTLSTGDHPPRTSWCRCLRMPRLVGLLSCDPTEKAFIIDHHKRQWRRRIGVDRVYSFTLSLPLPTTNILVPLLENVTPCGRFSCDPTAKVEVNEGCGGDVKRADDEVAGRVPHRPGFYRQFRRGQSCDCRKVRRSEVKGDYVAVCRSAKLAGSPGSRRPYMCQTPLCASWLGRRVSRASHLPFLKK